MRKRRINRAAICSSENYAKSRKLHFEFLKERHSHFKEMRVSGELSFDVPILKDGKVTPRFKTIRVWGKEMTVTMEEYNTYCKSLGL